MTRRSIQNTSGSEVGILFCHGCSQRLVRMYLHAGKEPEICCNAVPWVRKHLPFSLVGLDLDNSGELAKTLGEALHIEDSQTTDIVVR